MSFFIALLWFEGYLYTDMIINYYIKYNNLLFKSINIKRGDYMSSVLSILVIVWVIYMIVKKHYPQAVLLFAGVILLAWAVFVE